MGYLRVKGTKRKNIEVPRNDQSEKLLPTLGPKGQAQEWC